MSKDTKKDLKDKEDDPWKALDMGREYVYPTDTKHRKKKDVVELGEDTDVKELYEVEKAKRQDSAELEKKNSEFEGRNVNQADFHVMEGKNVYP